MITLAILFILIVVGIVLTIAFNSRYQEKRNGDDYIPLIVVTVTVSGLSTIIFLTQVIFGIGHYCDSLELEKLRAQALTAKQAVLKTHNYSNKSFSACGNVLGGEL